jgi:predicted GTPase
MKSMKMKWAGHVARMMKKRAYRVLVRKHDNKPLVIFIDLNVRLILEFVLKKADGNEMDLFS